MQTWSINFISLCFKNVKELQHKLDFLLLSF